LVTVKAPNARLANLPVVCQEAAGAVAGAVAGMVIAVAADAGAGIVPPGGAHLAEVTVKVPLVSLPSPVQATRLGHPFIQPNQPYEGAPFGGAAALTQYSLPVKWLLSESKMAFPEPSWNAPVAPWVSVMPLSSTSTFCTCQVKYRHPLAPQLTDEGESISEIPL
jgi:hypothetical protein